MIKKKNMYYKYNNLDVLSYFSFGIYTWHPMICQICYAETDNTRWKNSIQKKKRSPQSSLLFDFHHCILFAYSTTNE